MTLDWDSLDAGKYRDETETVTELVARSRFSADERASIREEAETLVADARYVARRHGVAIIDLKEDQAVLLAGNDPHIVRETLAGILDELDVI